MPQFDRRSFLRASMTGAASLAAWQGGFAALGADKDDAKKSAESNPTNFNNGNPDTFFLTWQRDPTTTMTATWVGPEMTEEETQVTCSVRGKQDWQPVKTTRHPYPGEGLFVYRAEATGLEPDSQYKFRIGKHTHDHRFQTMPAKATDTFQFISGGDSGGGTNAIASNIMAAKQDPRFVLMGGDLAYENGVSVSANLRFLKNYTQHMLDSGKRHIPLIPAIGNHEVTSANKKLVAPFFSALYGGLFPEKTYASLDFGDYLSLVLLDTAHVEKVEGEQTAWLDQTLAQRTDRPHLIVAQHVPSYPSYRSFDSTGVQSRRHWVPLFQKHNVDIVLEHHDHTFKRTRPLKDGLLDKNGLVYLGDGSWGMLRGLKDPEKRPYLATYSANYHVTLHRLEGEQRFHLALGNDGRIADMCTTIKRPLHAMGRGA